MTKQKNKWDIKPKKFKKKYGFDKRDLWSLDQWLARELSKRLLVWIEIGPHGHPEHMTYEGWIAQLKWAAEELHAYSIDGDHEQGKIAMYWIANNFYHLWD